MELGTFGLAEKFGVCPDTIRIKKRQQGFADVKKIQHNEEVKRRERVWKDFKAGLPGTIKEYKKRWKGHRGNPIIMMTGLYEANVAKKMEEIYNGELIYDFSKCELSEYMFFKH